ncbi:ABC-three component system middle component 6 [Yersinia aldovae]|uniref:ABC-three component system middle component 6 n=1 Tax=Yersinia aldovae TaxID=29483 RepID=UPI0037039979
MQSSGKTIMILSNSLKPYQTIYYFGAKLLQCMRNEPSLVIDSLDLFEKFKKSLPVKVTFAQFMYTLDWLYLLDLIELSQEGDIIVCF